MDFLDKMTNNSLPDKQLTATPYVVLISRLEPILLIALIAFSGFISLGNPIKGTDEVLIAFGLLVLWVGLFIIARNRPSSQFIRSLVLVSIAMIWSLSTVETLIAFNVWFFLIIVYYSFLLSKPYDILNLIIIPILFTLSYLLSHQSYYDWREHVARMLLMFSLGIIMIIARRLIQRTIASRLLLMQELEATRDEYAIQLSERTRELEQEVLERQQAESRLAREHQLLMTIIDTFPSRLFVKDRNSRFTLVNRWSLQRLGFDSVKNVIGKSDADFYPHFAERTYIEEQKLMATGQSVIGKEETTEDKTGVKRHYLISKVPMLDPQSDEIIGLVGVTTDVTSLKQTEIALGRSEATQKAFQQRLKSLNLITLSLTRIKTFDELVYQSIHHGINELGFDRLNCWFLDSEKPNILVGSYRVDEHRQIVSSQHEQMSLIESHPAYDVIRGHQTGRVIYDAPLYDVNFQEIGHGDKAFVALLDGTTVIGCLYTDTLLSDEPLSQSSIELLNLYGATLGVLFNRQRSQEALQASEEEALSFQRQLKQLNEITLELSAIDDLDNLCKQAVLLGRDILGFVRIGIWLVDKEDPTIRRGTWGIDKDGNLNDEHHMTFPIIPREVHMQSEGAIRIFYDEEFYKEGTDEPFGKGWLLAGLFWDGTKSIGWLFSDEGAHTIPLTPNRIELFRLYTAQLGLLCTQRIAQDELRQSEIRYRAITEASSDIIVIVDVNNIVTYISPSLKTVIGNDPDNIIGRSVSEIMHRDDVNATLQLLEKCYHHARLQTRLDNFRVRHADGHWLHMEAVMTSMVDNPIIKGVVVSCRDLTERRIAEEQKRQAEYEQERALLLRQFISDISHDFRTPLSTISTNAYLLKQGQPDKLPNRVAVIQRQVERITSLIDNMNMIAKLDAMTEMTTSLLNVNQILEMIADNRYYDIEKKNIKLQLDLQETLPRIEGSDTLLNEAISHLIDNAIQFSHQDGEIIIQSYQSEDYIVVQIADTGMGIAEQDQPFIFNRLYRANKARTPTTSNGSGGGLGLTITRRIIELHHGYIDLYSQVGQGTRIQLKLPMTE